MKIEPLTVATTASLTAAASNLGNAQQVLVQNTGTAAAYVHIETGTSGTRYASFYVPNKSNIIVRKNMTDEIFASTAAAGTGANIAVLFTKTGFYA
tara:strand:- start:2264 stop:2551 length:288 start_codon:yes stop_codon:yes gene_type:complete